MDTKNIERNTFRLFFLNGGACWNVYNCKAKLIGINWLGITQLSQAFKPDPCVVVELAAQ